MKKIRSVTLLLIVCLLFSVLSPGAMAVPSTNSQTSVTQTPTSQPTDTQATATLTEKNDDGLAVPSLSSKYVILADIDTGKILYSRSADSKAYPASLTKIMTALLAVEAVEAGTVSLTDKITAYDDCRSGLTDDSSTSNITPGEVLSFEDLLYCALVESANEACNIIAERLGGSISAFVETMNAKAQALGCKGTKFANPNGMPDPNHYTTAEDMYLITKEAISHDLFMTVCNTQRYTVEANNKSKERVMYNSNALISAKGLYGGGYIYSYAQGVKTGHTGEAGYCLVSTAVKNNVRLLCVVMGAGSETKPDGSTKFGNFSDAISLYNWAFENYKYCNILTSSALLSEVKIKYAPKDGNTVTLHADKDISVLVPANTDEKAFEKKITLYEDDLTAPIEAGKALGEVEISLNGQSCGKAKLLASSSVELSRSQLLSSKVQSTFSHWWVKLIFIVLILIILAYVFLVVRYQILRERRRRAKLRARRERRKAMEQQAGARGVPPDYSARMDYYRNGKCGGSPGAPQSQRDYFDDFFRGENDRRR